MRPLDEEAKVLLRRIVESLAARQLASINILGHSLKYAPELEIKLAIAAELDLGLRLFRQVRGLYGELGWTDLESAVRDRDADIPYPASRLEFGLFYHVVGLAESVAMESYVESSSSEFAAIARSHVEAAARRPEPSRFLEFAAQPTNRPQAQQFLNRWAGIARASFGRPGTGADARAVVLGLRSRTAAAMGDEFERRLAPLLARASLVLPAAGEHAH
jgi:1,2-phenylacetyl-CoA epoxidase catalytic subunit